MCIHLMFFLTFISQETLNILLFNVTSGVLTLLKGYNLFRINGKF